MNSYLPKTAISTAEIVELLNVFLVSANTSGTYQKSWNELLAFLEYANLGLLAREEGIEYQKAESWFCGHAAITCFLSNPSMVSSYIKDVKDPS